MNFLQIIDKYYPEENSLKEILIRHSVSVTHKALEIAEKHPEFAVDIQFIEEAAMLHDIGIFRCDAAGIQCFGNEPYIRHGIIGGELLRSEGYPRHARVCERHTGTGLTLQTIIAQNLPLPHQDFSPETLEEQIICYADKFFSKTRLDEEKTLSQARQGLMKFGTECITQFDKWTALFG